MISVVKIKKMHECNSVTNVDAVCGLRSTGTLQEEHYMHWSNINPTKWSKERNWELSYSLRTLHILFTYICSSHGNQIKTDSPMRPLQLNSLRIGCGSTDILLYTQPLNSIIKLRLMRSKQTLQQWKPAIFFYSLNPIEHFYNLYKCTWGRKVGRVEGGWDQKPILDNLSQRIILFWRCCKFTYKVQLEWIKIYFSNVLLQICWSLYFNSAIAGKVLIQHSEELDYSISSFVKNSWSNLPKISKRIFQDWQYFKNIPKSQSDSMSKS